MKTALEIFEETLRKDTIKAALYFNDCVSLMDRKIRDILMIKIFDVTDLEFLEYYSYAHQKKYNSEFIVPVNLNKPTFTDISGRINDPKKDFKMINESKNIPIYKQLIEECFLVNPIEPFSLVKKQFFIKRHKETNKILTIYHDSVLGGYVIVPQKLNFEIVQCENGEENLFFDGDERPYSALALISKPGKKKGTQYIKVKE